jgi:hypothetical protein
VSGSKTVAVIFEGLRPGGVFPCKNTSDYCFTIYVADRIGTLLIATLFL